MTGYLEGYGAGEERRENTLKKVALGILILIIAAVAGYFQFRNYREDRQFALFLDLLAKQDQKGAYELWGCTEQTPCRDYSFEKFLEDWGPKSPHTDVAHAHVTKTRSCSSGVIKTLAFPKDEVLLWVERKDRTIGYAPWPTCNPRMQAP